jgi:hypothetical protein
MQKVTAGCSVMVHRYLILNSITASEACANAVAHCYGGLLFTNTTNVVKLMFTLMQTTHHHFKV